jgi:hypothetical protein
VHPNLGENAISWQKVQIPNATLVKKVGRRAQISRVGCKLLYEIHPRLEELSKIMQNAKEVHVNGFENC